MIKRLEYSFFAASGERKTIDFILFAVAGEYFLNIQDVKLTNLRRAPYPSYSVFLYH
jgi:hypothetical protein